MGDTQTQMANRKSQLAGARRDSPTAPGRRQMRATFPVFHLRSPAATTRGWPVVRNKANSSGRLPASRWPAAPNKANSPLGLPGSRQPAVRNKANLDRPKSGLSGSQKEVYGRDRGLALRENKANFRAARRGLWGARAREKPIRGIEIASALRFSQ